MPKGLIVKELPDLNQVINEVLEKFENCGAICIFIGIVKGKVENKKVYELEYEVYEPYASKKLQEIAEKYCTGNVLDVHIYHRIGKLKPNEKILYIIVFAIDRKSAIKTCENIIEDVKNQIPIFKLERREDGEYWIIGNGKKIKRNSV